MLDWRLNRQQQQGSKLTYCRMQVILLQKAQGKSSPAWLPRAICAPQHYSMIALQQACLTKVAMMTCWYCRWSVMRLKVHLYSLLNMGLYSAAEQATSLCMAVCLWSTKPSLASFVALGSSFNQSFCSTSQPRGSGQSAIDRGGHLADLIIAWSDEGQQ